MTFVSSPDYKEFLVEKILKNYSSIFDNVNADLLSQIKRETITHPVLYVGMGTCGLIAGAGQTLLAIQKYLTENQVDAEIVRVGCLGLCSAEPLLDVQLPGMSRISFHHVIADKVAVVLDSVFHRQVTIETALGQYRHSLHQEWANIPYLEQLPYFAMQQRILLSNAGIISPYSIDDYIVNGGYKSLYKTVLNYTADNVCEIIDQSELRGRGGGGFPTGKKWLLAKGTGSDQKYLICNADESDPGAFMNRAIIEGDPHRVLEGIAISAYAIGANNAFIYVRSEYEQSINNLENAIKQAKEYGFIGENIFSSGFNLNIYIRQGAGAFICGEETALIESLEGRRGIPRSKPPYPAEKGLGGHPTVVNNIETLANIPTILENGPSWFKTIGIKQSSGTKIFSIAGKALFTGVIEIPMGIPVSAIVNTIAGGVRNGKRLKAVQFGGPMGICIPAGNLETVIGYESLLEVGSTLGLGGLIVLDEDTCMVNLSKYFVGFLQKESCGKCIPCREGTRRMLQILEEFTSRPMEEDSHGTVDRLKGLEELEILAQVIRDTSLCGLGQYAPNPVLSSMVWFREEYEEHILNRKCKAGICHDLRIFFIDTEVCNGCNECQIKCPADAIIGSIKKPHFIVESKCTGCGICFDICKFNAIYFK